MTSTGSWHSGQPENSRTHVQQNACWHGKYTRHQSRLRALVAAFGCKQHASPHCEQRHKKVVSKCASDCVKASRRTNVRLALCASCACDRHVRAARQRTSAVHVRRGVFPMRFEAHRAHSRRCTCDIVPVLLLQLLPGHPVLEDNV